MEYDWKSRHKDVSLNETPCHRHGRRMSKDIDGSEMKMNKRNQLTLPCQEVASMNFILPNVNFPADEPFEDLISQFIRTQR